MSEVTTEKPIHSAFRARCLRLAPRIPWWGDHCYPPLWHGFPLQEGQNPNGMSLATAGAAPVTAGLACRVVRSLGLRQVRYVLRTPRPPHPAPRLTTLMKRPLQRDGMKRI